MLRHCRERGFFRLRHSGWPGWAYVPSRYENWNERPTPRSRVYFCLLWQTNETREVYPKIAGPVLQLLGGWLASDLYRVPSAPSSMGSRFRDQWVFEGRTRRAKDRISENQ